MAAPTLRINEIFYSLQGESSHAGRPCVFVRLTGCPLRCNYCDTEYAFHEGRWMSLDEIVVAVRAHPVRLVEVTGGEPLAQPGAVPLMELLLQAGCASGSPPVTHTWRAPYWPTVSSTASMLV